MRYTYILIPKNEELDVQTYSTNKIYNSYFFDTGTYYLYRFDRKIKYMKRIISHDNIN